MLMTFRKWLLFIFLAVIGFSIWVFSSFNFQYAYMPPDEKIIGNNVPNQNDNTGIKNVLNEENPVTVNDELLNIGREAFYKETFSNEIFLTDVMGIVDGALTIPNMMKAILSLKGEGTSNLRVELAETVQFGDKTYEQGSYIDTGIDVAKGTYVPIGMPVSYTEGKVKVGTSCAACHATVDPETKEVIEGAPNEDLNAGMLMALATNSSAYFTHAQINSIKDYITDQSQTVVGSDGETKALPDPELLEEVVDATFAKWAPGNFDSTIDMKANPAQIPDSFTLGDHPYGWSGFAAAGPFKGLSAFSNNVHAQNSDSLSQAEASPHLFEIDKEVYLGTILQNAPDEQFRFDPEKGAKPSKFFAAVDPNPEAPGVNEMVKSPMFPKVSLIAPDGMFISSPEHPLWQQVNGMAAWQNTLKPPKPEKNVNQEQLALGEDVFNRAGCISCHAGETFTNNKIIPAEKIGTEPSRAKALKKTERIFSDSYLYPFDAEVPIAEGEKAVKVPTSQLDRDQIKLGFAHGDSQGGYKVKGLIGLNWSAPYLHDGGIAVGPNIDNQLGLPGTLLNGIKPDPANSLKALIDQQLRKKVIQANQTSSDLQDTHTSGVGHEFWVDASTGFTEKEQQALIDYLLSLD
jgi:mono/diheme cytochrome c family protein